MATAVYLNSAHSNPFQATKCKYAAQSVRAVPIRVLSVGKKRSRELQLMIDEYAEKIKYYCSFEDVQIRPNPRNARDQRAQVDDEDAAMMNHIRL
ncbi:Putative RNA methyltransferase [Arachis hypogaea]|nr:Putative RNA methyltransferase [Arachis hypogaea]QHN89076.1 Putative RNA methyltransferase [Arachis hypogaea]